MKKSEFTQPDTCNCGCKGGGLGSSTGYISNSCGCGQGLGDPADTTETQKDLITEAKKYINGEIPTKVKVAAGLGVIGLLLLAKKRGR